MTATTTTRHLYHYPDMTDLSALRREARERADQGERVVLHLHEYEDEFDGCGYSIEYGPNRHELFEKEDA